eukprot:365962-Chlamydomonas_euryale.AAC.2
MVRRRPSRLSHCAHEATRGLPMCGDEPQRGGAILVDIHTTTQPKVNTSTHLHLSVPRRGDEPQRSGAMSLVDIQKGENMQKTCRGRWGTKKQGAVRRSVIKCEGGWEEEEAAQRCAGTLWAPACNQHVRRVGGVQERWGTKKERLKSAGELKRRGSRALGD